MPGERQHADKEKIIYEPELETMANAGLAMPLQKFKLIVTLEDGTKREEQYDLIYLQGHGIGLYSYHSSKTYVLTLYGLRCLACGLNVNQGDIIMTSSGAAQAHLENVVKDVARIHSIGSEVQSG